MRIAIEGCSHGELQNIYASVLRSEREGGFRVDLLLLCGDFQAIRNHADLKCIAMPEKYRKLGEFHPYYSGEKVAPMLTIVIGGNHEASNYMWELYHGGWLAPNIYYLGVAGAIEVGGLKIAGASGIFKSNHYRLGRFERMPYSNDDMRSVYHTRAYDITKLMLLDDRPDILLSHDWPNTIEQHGDTAALIKRKPYFSNEIATETLGSPPLLQLLKQLKPSYWFSAHLHIKFAALFKHDGSSTVLKGSQGHTVASSASSSVPVATASAANSEVPDVVEEEDEKVASVLPDASKNPEKIDIAGENAPGVVNAVQSAPTSNPDEIHIDDSDEEMDGACQGNGHHSHEQSTEMLAAQPDESAERLRTTHQASSHESGPSSSQSVNVPTPTNATQPLADESGTTRFLALSKCMPTQDFLQFLEVPAPYDEALSAVAAASDTSTRPQLPIRYSARWLAISRAMHPYLCLSRHQMPALPEADDRKLCEAVAREERWVQENLLSGSARKGKRKATWPAMADGDTGDASTDEMMKTDAEDEEATSVAQPNDCEESLDPLDIRRVQMFVRTAPSPNEPGGTHPGPPPWYTNPQTEAFCAFLGIKNKINPAPEPPMGPPSNGADFSAPPMHFHANLPPPQVGPAPHHRPPFAERPTPAAPPMHLPAPPHLPSHRPSFAGRPAPGPEPPRSMLSEEEEVARIMRAAEARRKEREREHASKVAGAPKHQLMQKEHTGEERESEQGDEDVVTLDDSDVRWGEGAG